MPPTKIDEVSAAIGRLDQYCHENQNAVNIVGQKLDAAVLEISKQIAVVGAKIDVRLNAIELQHAEEKGRNSVFMMIIKSPAVVWILTALAGFYAWASGKLHL